MQVTFANRVEDKLLVYSSDERKRVDAWFGHLRNWEKDSVAKSRSVLLDADGRSEYVLRTPTELYIFFTVDLEKQTICVVDIATKATVLAFSRATSGGA